MKRATPSSAPLQIQLDPDLDRAVSQFRVAASRYFTDAFANVGGIWQRYDPQVQKSTPVSESLVALAQVLSNFDSEQPISTDRYPNMPLQDRGPRFRDIIGVPGGLTGTLGAVIRQANVNGMTLAQGGNVITGSAYRFVV